MQNVQFGADSLRGDIEVSAPKLLCIATPYSAGWTGYIDGKEAEVYCVNEHYLGLLIPEGRHVINLHYRMPYKTAGFALSLLGMAAFGAVCLFTEKKCRKGGKLT